MCFSSGVVDVADTECVDASGVQFDGDSVVDYSSSDDDTDDEDSDDDDGPSDTPSPPKRMPILPKAKSSTMILVTH